MVGVWGGGRPAGHGGGQRDPQDRVLRMFEFMGYVMNYGLEILCVFHVDVYVSHGLKRDLKGKTKI